MALGIRIKEVQEKFSNNVSQFAKAIGQPNHSNITNIIHGKTVNPRFDLIEAILNTYKEVDARWLITGEGEMLNKKQADSSVVAEKEVCYDCYRKEGKLEILSQENAELKKTIATKDSRLESQAEEIGRLKAKLGN